MMKVYTKGHPMKHFMRTLALIPLLIVSIGAAHARGYADTIAVFKNAGASGKGRVYVHGVYTGNATLGQVSVGFQAGGKAYSQIIFFEDQRALDEFESGNFEFGADASVVAVTAGANAGAATNGAAAGASAGPNDATTHGIYKKR